MESFILKNCKDVDGNEIDVFISDGLIAEKAGFDSESIDCTGLVALPGFIDLHTHLRQPGFEQSETVLSGSKSAAAGGFVSVHAMANTFPVADNATVVEQVAHLGETAGLVLVRPVGAVTLGLKGEELAELGSMAKSKANVRIFSDDGNCVSDSLVMRRALEYVKSFDGVIAQHAQEPRLTENAQMNEGKISSELGLAGWPAVAEEAIIARDIMLTELTGSRLHVCHVSTKGSVGIIRAAKARGVNVTAEVTPHHLLLSEEFVRTYDPLYKVNPPLRSESDIEAVLTGLVDGTIDAIATDHAPHPSETKACEWSLANFGMVGLESAFAVAHKVLIESGKSNYQRLAEVMSFNPARISGLQSFASYLTPGGRANLTLIDPNASWISESKTMSLSSNNPYVGMKFAARVIHTIFGGRFTYKHGIVQTMMEN